MKQIIQDLQSGQTILEELPVPQVKKGQLLIKTHRSLVSLGTERMLVEFGKANFLEKARQQPDKVKQVLDKIKADGLRPTLEAVFRKLGEPLPLGYCNAGEVIAIGECVQGYAVGDRVVSNGHHAEVVCIPQNLVAKIPDNVSYTQASFTVIGAIGLQGIRLVAPTFGETIVVIGLGLIGQLTAQMLKANGCRVIGFDFDAEKVKLLQSKGIEAYQSSDNANIAHTVKELTQGIGADGVVITASTKSNQVIADAAKMSRKRGRIVLVGVVGLEINRADFYEKELSFQVSCSYGPGRYDSQYENQGIDYPIGFVRWTEQRNFEAILRAISQKSLEVDSLISEELPLENYQNIYGAIGSSKSIATILQYSGAVNVAETKVSVTERNFSQGKACVAIIGAGNYTKATILPHLTKTSARIKYISSAGGLSSKLTAAKHKIEYATTANKDIFEDTEVEAVIISTQHHTHAPLVLEALKAHKHVFVEKPLALNYQELEDIKEAYLQQNKTLTVGFNRRFSPFAQEAKKLLGENAPMNIIATMNAGFIPAHHWTQNMALGGGRIIGEACHLIDLLTFLTGSLVESVVMNALGTAASENTDNASILLKFANGSTGCINYFSNGHKAYSKERVEIFSQERTIIIDNFRKAAYFGFKKTGLKTSQDKGHKTQFENLVASLQSGGSALIPFEQIYNTSKTAIAAVESLQTGTWVKI